MNKPMTPNGKSWQIAFWVMSSLCLSGMFFIGNNVINNDRKREDGDTKIKEEVQREIKDLRLEISSELKDMRKDIKDSTVKIAEILAN